MDRDHPHADRHAEILSLADAHVQGNLSAEMARRLERLLLDDAEARRLYVEYLQDSYHLHLLAAHAQAGEESDAELGLATSVPSVPGILDSGRWAVDSGEGSELRVQGSDSGDGPATSILPPSVTIHYPLSAIHSFVGGVLFSYSVAAIVVCVGLLIAAAWRLPEYSQIAYEPPALRSPSSTLHPVVGHITDMVDCEWSVVSGQWPVASGQKHEEPSSASHWPLATGHLVRFGDKFNLASGLLEITYSTGARVILQGPVTYEVESNGGFLSLGRLTGRLDKGNDETRMTNDERKHEIQMAESERQNSSFVIRPSSFIIRTPTATVTDLGTEFGVHVKRDGAAAVHVFVGSVMTTVAHPREDEPRTVTLRAGQSWTITADGQTQTAGLLPGDATALVRVMPSSASSPRILVEDDAGRPAHECDWREGDWGGVGWGSGWRLAAGGKNGSCFIGTSGSIDINGKSFGTSSKNTHVEASRDFVFDDLPVGATFMVDFANGRAKQSDTGFGLYNAKGEHRFELCVHDTLATYRIWDSAGPLWDTGVPYSKKGIHVELTRTGVDSYDVKIVRLGDNKAYLFHRAFGNTSAGKDIARFRHWNATNGDDVCRAYFNRVRVMEPEAINGQKPDD